jgi:outer membrane receptor for ferrienterochelin and colicins
MAGEKRMYRNILFILVLGVFGPHLAMASGGTVSGTIIDQANGDPIPHAAIIIEGSNLGDISDDNGQFIVQNITPGRHKLLISLIGYEAISKSIEVARGDTLEIDLSLKETALQGRGVVVTGTRTPRFIKDVPVYTEVLTYQEMEDKSAHSIYEALDGTSGIRVEQQCQACNFSVLRMQGLGADHTQILLDGQPVYSGLASIYGLQQLSTADVDQIEIVKGAGSALYGSNAIAGAINIISHVPATTEGHVGMEIGEYGTNKYEISAGVRQDNLAVFLYAQQTCGDEIDETGEGYTRDEVNRPDGISDRVRTNNKNAGFSLTIEDLTDFDQITIKGRIANENRQGGELTDDLFENIFAPGTERIITDRHSLDFGYGKVFANGIELNLSTNYARHKRNATNDTFLGDYESIYGVPPPLEELRPYIANEYLYVATVNFMYPLGGSHRLLFGSQYSHNKLEETGKYMIVDEGNPDYGKSYTSLSSKKADEVGLYLQDEYSVTSDFEVVGGLRFDYHKSEDNFHGSGDISATDFDPIEYNESCVNPRLAVKHSLTPELTLRGSFGTGFRVPYGFSEDLHLCSGSPRVYKDISLKPEKSRSFGLTLDYRTSALGLSLNLYRTDLFDRIDFSESDEEVNARGYTYQWRNIDDGYSMGLEVGADFALLRDLALALSVEFNQSEYDNPREDWLGTEWENDSKKFSRYPETSGGLKIKYTPSKWDFIIDAAYKGKMYIDLLEPANEEDIKIKETESFIIVNAKVAWSFFGRYKLYVGVKNLTDYVQEEKHVDDAAFLFAPVYGRLIYSGIEVSL